MSPKNLWSRRPWIAAFIFALVAGLTVFMSGQQGGRMADPSSAMHVPILSHGPQEDSTELQGLPDDWTHHHLVFSDPGTEEDAISRGAHEQWLSIVNDPRYITQQLKRHAPARGPWAEYVDRMNEMALAQNPAGGDESGARQVQDSVRPVKGTRPSRPSKEIRSDWQMDLGASTAATITGTVGSLSLSTISGSSTLAIGGVTFDASAPVAEVATISVPNNIYCIPPSAGFTLGTTPTNVTTNGTAPSAGSIEIGSDSGLSGMTVTIGGVTYTYESSLTNTGCGTTLNCLIEGGTGSGHDVSAEALYRAVNNSGNCTDSSFGQCYVLATGQGANTAATASHTADTTITSISTWKCAGTVASLWSVTCGSGETCTAPTGGAAGSGSANIIMPATMSNSSLATAINTAITGSAAAGFTHTAPSSTITLTASAAGSTGIQDALDGAVTGVTVGVTTAGSDGATSGATTPPTFAYWSGNTYLSSNSVAANIVTAMSGNPTIAALFSVTNPSAAQVKVTDHTYGVAGNRFALTPGSFSAFTGGSLTGGAGTVGAGQYPAKYSFSTTAAGLCSNSSTPDYVVYNTGMPGASGSQANIIAYDNIYSGCSSVLGASTTVPLVYWSYYTGTGVVATSPVISFNGNMVAFIETPSSGAATLRILEFVGGQGTDYKGPLAPQHLYTNSYAGATGNTAWSTCPAGQSCLISVAFQTETNPDTTSAPWYDYASDTLWVGDSGGYLHEFTGVFTGTPGELTNHASPGTCGTSCSWPVLVSSGNALTGPVYDNTAGHTLIFVGSSNGHLESVSNSTTAAAVKTSNQIGSASSDISDAPLVDPAAGASSVGEVYAFVSGDAASSPSSGIFQFAEGSISAASGSEAKVGTGSTGSIALYAGTFDNKYFTASSSSSPSGNLWVCGNTGGNPTLWDVPISSNAFGTPAAGPVVSATGTTCSPVGEFCTNSGAACTNSVGTDYIFASPQTEPSSGQVSGCTASEGCVISYTLSSTGATATLKAAGPFPGGASGLVIDTQSSTPSSGTLQLYFGILGSLACTGSSGPISAGTGAGGCAIQAPLTAP